MLCGQKEKWIHSKKSNAYTNRSQIKCAHEWSHMLIYKKKMS